MKPGDRIEHYTLLEQIGQGGQAAVWSAEDDQLKRIVAVKTISLLAPLVGGSEGSASGTAAGSSAATVSADEQALRFRSEAKIIAELEHPYILPVYSFGQKDDWLYIIMRYMPGGTLRKLIDKHPLDLPRVIKLLEPLADALDMAHERRIVHRDIKSVNILLDGQNRPYLADFGLSVTSGDASSGSASGTLAYMAPEQLRSEPVDHYADLYAFGILLYELFTGSVPRIGSEHWNIAQLTRREPLPIPSYLSEPIANVLRRATALNKSERYESAMATIQALRDAQADVAMLEIQGEGLAFDVTSVLDDDGLIMMLPTDDPAMQASIDAVRIVDEALTRWADGAGRFRFYEEDFKYADSFYRMGDEIGIELSDSARRLMLRGALEYGFNLDYWWGEGGTTADRRMVALQSLSSDLPAARLRALECLALLPDSSPPAIPIRTATIIAKEPEPSVRLAGIELLRRRAGEAKTWREAAYTPEIDQVLADLAVKDPDAAVRRTAARAIASLRSASASRAIAAATTEGKPAAFEALTIIRDLTPHLPSGIASGVRGRVFAAVSLRQFFQRGLLGRWLSASGGFIVAWAIVQTLQYGTPESRQLLFAQAVGNGLASGALYGALFGVAILLAAEIPARLRAWNRLARTALGVILGGVVAVLAFYILRRYYYFDPEEMDSWAWFLTTSVGFIGGFALLSGLTRWSLARAAGGMVGVAAALYASHEAMLRGDIFVPLIYFVEESPNQPLYFALFMGVVIAFFAFLPDFFRWIGGKLRGIAGG